MGSQTFWCQCTLFALLAIAVQGSGQASESATLEPDPWASSSADTSTPASALRTKAPSRTKTNSLMEITSKAISQPRDPEGYLMRRASFAQGTPKAQCSRPCSECDIGEGSKGICGFSGAAIECVSYCALDPSSPPLMYEGGSTCALMSHGADNDATKHWKILKDEFCPQNMQPAVKMTRLTKAKGQPMDAKHLLKKVEESEEQGSFEEAEDGLRDDEFSHEGVAEVMPPPSAQQSLVPACPTCGMPGRDGASLPGTPGPAGPPGPAGYYLVPMPSIPPPIVQVKNVPQIHLDMPDAPDIAVHNTLHNTMPGGPAPAPQTKEEEAQ